jgi:DNA polymerase-3 subunit delta
MIIKSFELKKHNLKNIKFFLIYGVNKGLLDDVVEEILLPNLTKNLFKYDEAEIFKNLNDFEQNISNKSFFENEKVFIINRASDKILNIIEDIISKEVEDLHIILLSGVLEKKSKIIYPQPYL